MDSSGCAFIVKVAETDLSKACKLQLSCDYELVIGEHAIALKDVSRNQELLYTWPYNFIRRYGRSSTSFTLEGGRRCESGPGVITFISHFSEDIFNAIQVQSERIKQERAQLEEKGKQPAVPEKANVHLPIPHPSAQGDMGGEYSQVYDHMVPFHKKWGMAPYYKNDVYSSAEPGGQSSRETEVSVSAMPGNLDMSREKEETNKDISLSVTPAMAGYLDMSGNPGDKKKFDQFATERPYLPTPSDYLTSNSDYSIPYAHVQGPRKKLLGKIYENTKDTAGEDKDNK